jgi:hypothetical protein
MARVICNAENESVRLGDADGTVIVIHSILGTPNDSSVWCCYEVR